MSPNAMLFVAIIISILIYVGVVAFLQKRNQKGRAIRALYVKELQEDANDEFSPYAAFCRDAVSAVGVNIAEQRKLQYNALGRAGLTTDAAVAKYLFFTTFIKNFAYLIGAGLIGLTILKGQMTSFDGMVRIGIGAGAILFCIMGPFSIDKMTKRRKENLQLEFPDAVDLLLVCVEAGMGLDAAIGRVCKELGATHPNIASELQRTKLELGVFGDRVQALLNLAERTDVQIIRSLVSALVQTEKYGTNLASTLRVLSADNRGERLLFAEQKAAKVGALLTLPVVVLVFFPVMALIMAPPFISIVNQGGLFGK